MTEKNTRSKIIKVVTEGAPLTFGTTLPTLTLFVRERLAVSAHGESFDLITQHRNYATIA